MANASRDDNRIPTLLGVSSSDGTTPVTVYVDPTTHRLLVDISGGGLNVETPTGSVNGSNTSFTVSNTPTLVIADGAIYAEGAGYSYSGGTITMGFAPNSFIRSLY